jgi:hypothetical protein
MGLDVEVLEIIPGLSADESNQFDVGDVVLYVDGKLVQGMPLAQVKQLTIGEVGTTVTLIMRSLAEVSPFALKTITSPFSLDLPLMRVLYLPLFSYREHYSRNLSFFHDTTSCRRNYRWHTGTSASDIVNTCRTASAKTTSTRRHFCFPLPFFFLRLKHFLTFSSSFSHSSAGTRLSSDSYS